MICGGRGGVLGVGCGRSALPTPSNIPPLWVCLLFSPAPLFLLFSLSILHTPRFDRDGRAHKGVVRGGGTVPNFVYLRPVKSAVAVPWERPPSPETTAEGSFRFSDFLAL